MSKNEVLHPRVQEAVSKLYPHTQDGIRYLFPMNLWSSQVVTGKTLGLFKTDDVIRHLKRNVSYLMDLEHYAKELVY